MASSVLRTKMVNGADTGQAGVRPSMRDAAVNVTARANVAAPLDDREAAERFSAAVIGFSAAHLARAARRTKAAAKGWKDASRAPGLSSTLNMARNIPAVRKWLLHEMGEVAEFDSPQLINQIIAEIDRRRT